MRNIPIVAEPSQELSVRLDDVRYTLRLKAANGVMVADISIDGSVILAGTRVLAGEPIIPYGHLQVGNFLLLTQGDALPDYAQFGVTQSLVYLSPAEIAAL